MLWCVWKKADGPMLLSYKSSEKLGRPYAVLLTLLLNVLAMDSLLVPILGSLTVVVANVDLVFGFSS